MRVSGIDVLQDTIAVLKSRHADAHALRHTVDPALAREAHDRAVGARHWAETRLSELIWLDLYRQVLQHHPRVATNIFKPGYDRIKWVTSGTPRRSSKSLPVVDHALTREKTLARYSVVENQCAWRTEPCCT